MVDYLYKAVGGAMFSCFKTYSTYTTSHAHALHLIFLRASCFFSQT